MDESEAVVTRVRVPALSADRDGLLAADQEERASEFVGERGRPLFAELPSVTDIHPHTGVWDDRVLARVREARHGRTHWSQEGRSEAATVGRTLDTCDLRTGGLLSVVLLRQRLRSSRDRLIDTLAPLPPSDCDARLAVPRRGRQSQALAGMGQSLSTPEGDPARVTPYLDAMAHLETSATPLETRRMVT